MIKKISKHAFLVFIAFGFQIGLNYNLSRIFLDEKIVPEIIPVPPVNVCRIFYPWGEIPPGGNISFDLSKKPPERVWWPAEEDSLYTLYLTGVIDWIPVMHRAPNKSFETAGKEWHQWMVINIPGNNLTAGETIYRYLQAGDPKLDVTDIYLYLIYKQPKRVFVNTTWDLEWAEFQRTFRPYRFARRHKLGSPVAGTYYLTYYNEYRGDGDSIMDVTTGAYTEFDNIPGMVL